jgi:hypothetical protein
MLLRMYLRWAERTRARQPSSTRSPRVRGRHLVGHVHGEGPPRLRPAALRARRAPPGADEPVQRPGQAPDGVRGPEGHAVPGGRPRHRHRRQGPADRHLPVLGRRRPARQRDRLGGAHHPPAHRHRVVVPERAQPAPEQGPGHAGAQGQAGRARAPEARGRARRHPRRAALGGLRVPDPLLRDAAVPDGQGPPLRARDRQRRRRARRRARPVHGGLPALAARVAGSRTDPPAGPTGPDQPRGSGPRGCRGSARNPGNVDRCRPPRPAPPALPTDRRGPPA